MPIINSIAAFHHEMTAWRRDLLAHPELSMQESRTSAMVRDKLAAFGVDEIITGMATHGVVGVIRSGSSGRAIGLRADMDAFLADLRVVNPNVRVVLTVSPVPLVAR